MWSTTVFDPALPARSRNANGSPVPACPWSTNAHNGWKPKPRLNVGAAHSFSECAVTSVASTSMTTGDAALASWSGHARRPVTTRSPARAEASAVSAAGASTARVSISRDTVGSEATGPKTSGAVRSCARSARQSPPIARLTARSATIFPGSWRASGRRHGASAADSAPVSPTVCAVRSSTVAPACETTLDPAPSTVRAG